MKKYILTVLALSTLLLSGCSNKTQGVPEQPSQVQQEVQKPEQPEEVSTTEKIKHEPSDEVDTQGWNGVGGTDYDFDSDGEDDKLQLFSSTFYKPDEEPLLDDGANWMITVTTKDGTYKLFEGYIQLGKPEIDVGELYNEETEKVIILTQTTSAGKSITHYTFKDGAFYEELVYSTDSFTEGGANIVESIN